ncbi:hypothetical protein BpHYR1_054441, partial [Brachionus plicatilis]
AYNFGRYSNQAISSNGGFWFTGSTNYFCFSCENVINTYGTAATTYNFGGYSYSQAHYPYTRYDFNTKYLKMYLIP